MIAISIKKINMATFFENLTVELHVFYVINMHIKFRANWMLFTISFLNLFFIYNIIIQNLKFKHLIDDIFIDLFEIL